MKHKTFICILLVEAMICIMFNLLQASLSNVFSAAMAFPFEQIGLGLRMLSLSGEIGNVAAFVVYITVSLLPAVGLLVIRTKRKLYAEDGLLGLFSVVLFAVIYLMINTGIINATLGGTAGQSVGKAILGGMAYSVLCGYLVLRVLRLFSVGGTGKLIGYMSVLLCLLNTLFVYLAFGASFANLLTSIETLRAGNVGNEHLLGESYFFLVLQFSVDALPYVLDIFIVYAALRLLDALRIDRYSNETVTATERLSQLCKMTLTATVLTNIGFNLLQFLFSKSIRVINTSVQIPVFSIAFILAALLLSRFVTENKQLKDDNDMFI